LATLPDGAPVAGDRFPWLHLKLQPKGSAEDLYESLDDTRFNLLVIGQPAPVERAVGPEGLIRLHAIPDDPSNRDELGRAKIGSRVFYLLRPDGYIGLAGSELDIPAINRYLADRCRIRCEESQEQNRKDAISVHEVH
jgi:hypothetical protein